MCIGGSPSAPAPIVMPAPAAVPEVVRVDPKVEAQKIDADATMKANAETAARRTNRRASALSTGAGMNSTSALGAGKTTLGG